MFLTIRAAVATTAALGLLAWAQPAAADPPIPLTTGFDIRYEGPTATERFGAALATGDVNGDGIDDVLFGAPSADYNGRTNSGSVYVLLGATQRGDIDMGALGSSGFRIDGAAGNDQAGTRLTVTDFNGDDIGDVVIAAAAAGGGGTVFVVYGRKNPTNVDLNALGSGGVRINAGAVGDNLGSGLAPVRDVDDDGRDEVAIGASGADPNGSGSGAVYVVLGRTSTAPINTATLGVGGYTIKGAASPDQTGNSVDNAGDVNEDGFDDLVIGAFNASANSRSQSGSAFVVFGKAVPGDVALDDPGSSAVRIDGAATQDQAGFSVAGIGDVNNDGVDDIGIGAIGSDDGGLASGNAYVVFGKPGLSNVDLLTLGASGFRMTGTAASANTGTMTAGRLDLNDDGVDDMVTTAPTVNNSFNLGGSTYVVYGGASVADRSLADIDQFGVRLDGGSLAERSGSAVTTGDINADGGRDLLIAAPLADYNSLTDSGAVYVVFGTPKPSPPPPAANPDPAPAPLVAPGKATLTVKARAAKKRVPRSGSAVLVKRVSVGQGQAKSITTTVTPKKARKTVRVTVKEISGKVRVKTDGAPRAKVRVRIVSSGSGVTPTSFTRTWRIR